MLYPFRSPCITKLYVLLSSSGVRLIILVRGQENIAKVIAPLAKNMAAFKKLVAEVDESGDKDKMAMFADALPKQKNIDTEERIHLNAW